jgi:hypothetical protein
LNLEYDGGKNIPPKLAIASEPLILKAPQNLQKFPLKLAIKL